MNLPKLIQGFAKIDTWISPSCYMDLSKEVRWVERGWTMEAAVVHFQPRKSASSRHLVAALRITGYKRHTWLEKDIRGAETLYRRNMDIGASNQAQLGS